MAQGRFTAAGGEKSRGGGGGGLEWRVHSTVSVQQIPSLWKRLQVTTKHFTDTSASENDARQKEGGKILSTNWRLLILTNGDKTDLFNMGALFSCTIWRSP